MFGGNFLRRKKVRKQAAAHFGTDDIIINQYRLNAVHAIPISCKENQELDFYLDTKYDIYLLRLKNNNKKCIEVFPAEKTGNIVYIVAQLPYKTDSILDTIQIVINRLQVLGIPKIVNPKQVIVIRL